MDPIYVTGHRNPDTDSIVAAMAYAALRNACGDREYEAACLGHVSDETQIVLDRFGFQPPTRIYNMYTQVCDLDFDTPPILSDAVTLDRAWKLLSDDRKSSALPVAREDGTLYGMLSREDVASYNMDLMFNGFLEPVPLFNVLSVLEGKVLNEAGESTDTISGEVTIALPCNGGDVRGIKEGSVVICGHQEDVVELALEKQASCVILCQTDLADKYRGISSRTCIIATPCDAYRAARMIYQAIPVGRIAQIKNIVHFHMDDYIDDVRDAVLQSRYRSYPVLDENQKVVGTLSRYHLIRPRRKRVVLMDHNERAQSVQGLEQAEIVAIVDHHRLADVQTGNPVFMRNEPVGSTTTIVATMYQERGLMPSQRLAGLMAAAILSDTVMFKSPTCTNHDRRIAERLARIAGIDLDELGKEIFSLGTDASKTVEELLATDFKEFHIAGHTLGIGQITCLDTDSVLARLPELLPAMEKMKHDKEYDMQLLMLTDVLREGTELIFLGDDDVIRMAFNAEVQDNHVFLPGVVSRKKQIVPALSLLWG